VPIPKDTDVPVVVGDRINVSGLWSYAGWPVARSRAGDIWVLGESASRRAAALRSLAAPDFALPDLEGRLHRLSDYRGRRIFLVTWASWCGCRSELVNWQALHESALAYPFSVVAVALDEAEAARAWIEAASPGYPCLIDRDHLSAELYNFVNVPEGVWIDEAGQIVRPPEAAGMIDSFRAMDRRTFALPEPERTERDRAKRAYLEAVRDWAARGSASPYALTADAVLARLKTGAPPMAQAHAHFRLGQVLLREGRSDEAAAAFAEATRLHPESWAMWRQTAEKTPSGLAAGEAFWRRVDALGDRPYYEPSDLTRARAASASDGSS
jgi:peroxiredoxin